MDPALISIIVQGLISGIKALDAIGQANNGLTTEQRDARRALRKELLDLIDQLGEPIDIPPPLDGD